MIVHTADFYSSQQSDERWQQILWKWRGTHWTSPYLHMRVLQTATYYDTAIFVTFRDVNTPATANGPIATILCHAAGAFRKKSFVCRIICVANHFHFKRSNYLHLRSNHKFHAICNWLIDSITVIGEESGRLRKNVSHLSTLAISDLFTQIKRFHLLLVASMPN